VVLPADEQLRNDYSLHLGVEGNETADEWTNEASKSMGDSVPRAYLREMSFAHMARIATEAKSTGASRRIGDHINRRRRYSPPKGQKLRKELRHERKALAGRYYQLLSGHVATGDYLCHKVHKLPSDRCWWCGRDERQTRHHLFVNCEAWGPQIRELWKEVGFCPSSVKRRADGHYPASGPGRGRGKGEQERVEGQG
jgi:hypothetical protein